MEFFVVIAILALIGSFLGWVAFFRIGTLAKEIERLKTLLYARNDNTEKTSPSATIAIQEFKPEIKSEVQPEEGSAQENVEDNPATIEDPRKAVAAKISDSASNTSGQPPSRGSTPLVSEKFIASLKQNWMTWLGGLCIALAGIFLARYSIQQGLVGPTARIASGIITGLLLHCSAEWLRRKTSENHQVFAMLAGGGSITLFATLLASFHYYQMFSPLIVFVILALVATATMWLSRIHGPVLAAMGMLGAYAVPMLVSTGSGNVLAAMLYSLVISSSILFLLRYIYRYWLWIGLLAGGLIWWGISLNYPSADGWRGLYLALFAYGLYSIIPADWLLQKKETLDASENPLRIIFATKNSLRNLQPLSLLLIIIAQCITILLENNSTPSLLSIIPLAAIVLLISNKKENSTTLAWGLYLGHLIVLLLINVSHSSDFYIKEVLAIYQADHFIFLAVVSSLFTVMAIRNFSSSQFKSWWSSLAILAPLLALIVSYLLGHSYLEDWQWSVNALVFGAFYIFMATKASRQGWQLAWTVWFFLAGHFAYTIAAVVLLDNAGLTIALALQAISIAVIVKRFDVPQIGWLLKITLLLVVARLTLNPWLVDYPAANHWSLWTYGGATLSCYIASRILKDYPKLSRWTEAASLHLFVLTLWAESRYWLYNGEVFSHQFTFIEAALNVSLFGTLALVYHYKRQVSSSLASLYTLYAKILMLMALGNYGLIIIKTLESDIWVWKSISETPIFNLLILGYLVPALIATVSYKYFFTGFKKLSAGLSAVMIFIFINVEIRHLWNGNINLQTTTSDAELYTYSVVWMLLAITAILAGSWRYGKQCYQGGMLLLAMVILKVFIIDMAQLDGVYRIIAFMGLGLSLLGIAYLHKKIGNAVFDTSESIEN
ncbi:MAG: hypothetical protein COA74_12530 [Gammaproteobacteria bacterium]|nr:MAG: hypothetical protein COA74_12530 [Gammaproteobacteria bacterium]